MIYDNGTSVGINNTTPSNCAIFDLHSTSTMGMLVPNLSLTSLTVYAPATGAAVDGLLIYNTNNAVGGGTGYYYWSTANGGKWINMLDVLSPASAWLTVGNGGLSAGTTNFMGTTDATPINFITNGTGNIRMTIDATGYVGINHATSANYQLSVSNSTFSATGDATIWSDAAGTSASNTLYSIKGVTESTLAYGRTIFGQSYGQFARSVIGGAEYSSSNGSTVGIEGYTSCSMGIAVMGFGGNTSWVSIPQNAGVGGDFGAPRYGIYSREMDSTTTSTSMTTDYYAGVDGEAKVQTDFDGVYNHYGIWGYYDNSAGSGYGQELGGVLGMVMLSASNPWTCLGYISTGDNPYAYYYDGSTGHGAGAIRNRPAPTDVNANIGMGGCGDLMGGWIKGNIYGLNISGSRYGLYVDGQTYTNDVIVQLSQNSSSTGITTNSPQRVATYVPTSTSVDIIIHGTGKVVNGNAKVDFDDNFLSLVSETTPIQVIITPIGQSNGFFISEMKGASGIINKGFTIQENSNGNSNVTFNWIAIGVRKGYEKPTVATELLSTNYDSNMSAVMHDENDQTTPAMPIWWDGTKLRFDKIPKSAGIGATPPHLMNSIHR